MFSPRDFALMLLQRNPNISSNPQMQNFVEVIKSGDNRKGEEIADNLCKTYGVDRDTAIQQAKNFFHIS